MRYRIRHGFLHGEIDIYKHRQYISMNALSISCVDRPRARYTFDLSAA